MDDLTYEQRQKQLETLNHKKRMLDLQTNILDGSKFAQDYLLLAGEYAAMDAKANQAYCMNRYYHYSQTRPEDVPVESGVVILNAVFGGEPFVAEPEIPADGELYDWQERADIGD